ncbi:MAG TPA: 50S ribosomal protein L11 methyltransferase [Acidimicrobiales bacterium]|nr:50S ribosomal protein L11 methyltransferase [Acidimicrobiales bacterium]
MSRAEIGEHAGYLNDSVKLDAYRAALTELVKPGMSVLDVGSGTGILGVMAVEAGARVVYAVESGGILGVARAVAAPVTTDSWERTVGAWARKPAGFDFSPVIEPAVNTEYRLELTSDAFLGQPAQFAEVAADHDAIRGAAELTIEREGDLHGIAGMFIAQLAPSVTLTNCPLLSPVFRRWQIFYPLPRCIAVFRGDVVVVAFDIRPRTYIAKWTVDVHRRVRNECRAKSRSSTALGEFLTRHDLAMAGGGCCSAHLGCPRSRSFRPAAGGRLSFSRCDHRPRVRTSWRRLSITKRCKAQNYRPARFARA